MVSGTLRNAQGVYEGEMHASSRHGTGVMKWADGRLYEGHFAEDEMCGEGCLSVPQFKIDRGQFWGGFKLFVSFSFDFLPSTSSE